MEFSEFIELVESTIVEASGHAFQRLERLYKAAQHSPAIIPNPGALYGEIKRLCLQAEQIYQNGNSYAVEVYRFPFIVGEESTFALGDMQVRNEPSNGNMVVAIIRPDDRGISGSQVVTIMFRRSDDLGRISQPFTPYALDTDEVVRLDQFKRDVAGAASYKPSGASDDFRVPPGTPQQPPKKKKGPPPRILRGGI